MGGCRCTYRNCTVKTDGKTHMFHYPVFEKVRCHQWLVNAQKWEFLNLKVSQLKNRVVCQHHFKEEKFMNYKKDKLTFDAIPTEDGPYCDPTKYTYKSNEHKAFSNLILLEDIENDYQIVNKKANFSLTYGDFLTNGELMDLQPKVLNLPSTDFTNKEHIVVQQPPEFNSQKYDYNLLNTLHEMDINKTNVTVSRPQELHQNVNTIKKDVNTPKTYLQQYENVKKEPKIKILSETKIQWPLPVTGKFEKITPETTLYIPNRSYGVKKANINQSSTGIIDNKHDNIQVLEVLDVEYVPKQEAAENEDANLSTTKTNIVTKQPSPRLLPNKSKLTPERTAAIERKRKFNMKLKDVIESCLNKLDEPIRNNVESDKSKTQRSVLKDNEVELNAPKDQPLPNIHEYTLAFLEKRMNKLEETLLNRIDNNSQKIMELKQSLGNKPTKIAKLVNTQTSTSDECFKKFLYKEISTYLSENAKNLIYEELFINKFSLNETTNSYNRKRRKCV